MSVSVYDFSMENKQSYVVVAAHWLQVDYVTLAETVMIPVVLRYVHVCAYSRLCSKVIFLNFQRLRNRTLSVKDTVEFSSNSSKSLWICREPFCNTVTFHHT